MEPTAENFPTRVSSWSDLAKLVEHFSFFVGHAWLFRGVTDANHALIPKVGRNSRKIKPGTPAVRIPYRIDDERAVFAMVKQQARAYLPNQPANDLEWLAIGQHFGLPTRFLDWTESLLVAAWFAVEAAGSKDRDSAIWVTREVPVISMDYTGDPLALPEPHGYRSPHITPRITAQASVFMICPNPTEPLDLPFLRKITIDRKAEFTIKKRLNACGLNRRVLFPDLGGLCEHLSWLYKNDWLAGYRSRQEKESTFPTSPDEPGDDTG